MTNVDHRRKYLLEIGVWRGIPVLAVVALGWALIVAGCATAPQARGVATGLHRAGAIAPSDTASIGRTLIDHSESKPVETAETRPEPIEPSLTHKILATALSKTGLPYRFGGTSPEAGFDCAGFVQWVYAQNGLELPRTTSGMSKIGRKVARDELMPGDLLFYWRNRGSRLMHVGLYLGNGRFIHSPSSGSRISEDEVDGRYYSSIFIQARRVLENPDSTPLPEETRNEIVARALKENRTVARPVQTASNSGSRKSYRVQKGDTVWALARRFGVSSQSILRANGLHASSKLKIGQRLAIP